LTLTLDLIFEILNILISQAGFSNSKTKCNPTTWQKHNFNRNF